MTCEYKDRCGFFDWRSKRVNLDALPMFPDDCGIPIDNCPRRARAIEDGITPDMPIEQINDLQPKPELDSLLSLGNLPPNDRLTHFGAQSQEEFDAAMPKRFTSSSDSRLHRIP